MCGNIALIDFTHQGCWGADGDIFLQMLLLNSIRGMDSTGVAGIRKDGDVDIVRAKGTPYHLMCVKGFNEWRLRVAYHYHALLGHGRLATKGVIKAQNAHPFRRGTITLIHNGTLTNFDALKKEYADKNAFEVDSDLCANHLHKDGLEALEKFEGAFAFIWHDSKDGKVRAVRNLERPLYVFEREDKKQYYLSSESAIFEYVKAKANIRGNWKTLQSGEMLEFDFKEKGMTVVPVKFHQKIWPVQRHTPTNNRSEYENDYWDMWAAVTERVTVPDKNKDTTVQTPKKELTKIEQGNVVLQIGDKINFQPNDFEDHQDNNTNEIWTIIKGTAITDIPVEVRARYDGDFNQLIDADYLQGTIKSITPYDYNNAFVCRLYLHKVEAIEDPNIIEGESEVFYSLADDTSIPKHRFDLLTKDPCVCGKRIVSGQSHNCIVVQGLLYCPDCTINSKYPKNG